MAGFQVTIHGRFWVTAEGNGDRHYLGIVIGISSES